MERTSRTGGFLGVRQRVALGDVVQGSCLDVDRAELAGRSVLVVTSDQLAAALALIELDGLARRLVVAPPDLRPEHLPAVIADAEVDAIVSDLEPATFAGLDVPLVARCRLPVARLETAREVGRRDRMGAAHLGDDRRAENGGAQP